MEMGSRDVRCLAPANVRTLRPRGEETRCYYLGEKNTCLMFGPDASSPLQHFAISLPRCARCWITVAPPERLARSAQIEDRHQKRGKYARRDRLEVPKHELLDCSRLLHHKNSLARCILSGSVRCACPAARQSSPGNPCTKEAWRCNHHNPPRECALRRLSSPAPSARSPECHASRRRL